MTRFFFWLNPPSAKRLASVFAPIHYLATYFYAEWLKEKIKLLPRGARQPGINPAVTG